MGLEQFCRLKTGRKTSEGKALLESDHLLFRGDDLRLKIPFSAIQSVKVDGGSVVIEHADGTAKLEIGPAAERWAQKIRRPPSRLDKLGVKPEMRVAVVGVDDDSFLDELRERTTNVSLGKATKGTDIIFFGAESAKGLSRLATLRKALVPNGAIWVVHRKGKEATLKDVEVFAAAKAVGLVDNKVASFSATHTAERLVIPVALR